EAKLPLEVTQGDVVRLPIVAVNGTPERLEGGSLILSASGSTGLPEGDRREIALAAGERGRWLVPLEMRGASGDVRIVVAATAGAYSDRVERPLRVVPLGFPAEVARGGVLPAGGAFSTIVEIPADVVPGSLRSEIKVYPSPLANLSQALERLIREPHGCFEQTSSTTYPLVMAQQYFLSHSGVDSRFVERSGALLEKGYQRLVSFECKKKGYEWFGADPGHEALTAYGLLQFTDMAKVRPVDRGMLDRTRAWLLGARDGKGNFKRQRRALHTWVEDRDSSNGYIIWSLLESGEEPATLAREIDAFLRAAKESDNSYVVALGALVAARSGRDEPAGAFRERLARQQSQDGSVDGATTSIVGSRGRGLVIEATSLSLLAWIDDPKHAGNVERAMRWIAAACENGRFGSTQSTVLALRAILAYDGSRSGVKRPGRLRVHVDGHAVGEAVAFDETSQAAIELPDISEMLHEGPHRVELRMADGSEMPFSLAITYHRTRPASNAGCPVSLEVSLRERQVAEGEVTEAQVAVENRSDEAVPMPVAVIGIPGGLEVRHDQLKELVKAGRLAAYEVRGREVVLYWRSFARKERRELPLSFVAAVPGSYTGPASRAYLYYTDEHKHWVEPLRVEISAAEPSRGR
ncbi:MAG: A-macroglobulin complement component, partial [Planctomycetota bacterium]|nr:A-macroglobulin complement component [Planctomycetota bacterium]